MNHESRTHTSKSGFTLIELLMYIAILGSLLIAVSLYFATTAESRVKNQTISEVNQQGALAMETITQIIRGADSITAPTAGNGSSSATLAVPTGGLNPTIFNLSGTLLGYDVDGGTTGVFMSNNIDATSFTASASGTVSALNALIGPTVDASPNNKGQMAIYSGATPTTLLARSNSVTLTANTWITFQIPSVSVTSGQTYWLAYNSNGSTDDINNLRYHTVGPNQSRYVGQTYGSWPASWSGTASNYEMSVYATIEAGATPAALQIKEGAGAVTPFTNGKIRVSGLSFKNLTRSSTPGIVQVNFTLSRLNPNLRNEYEYQKTFTGSAALRWP